MDLKDKGVYISGKMTGLPDFNRQAFLDAEKYIRKQGARYVYNPAIHAPKVEETKEEIGNYDVLNNFASSTEAFKLGVTRGLDLAVEILDKLIKESEG